MTTLQHPTVNLNGTSKRELVDQLTCAASAVQAAMSALCRAYPHGRDYPDRESYKRARAQFDDMHGRLESVLFELGDRYLAIH